MPNVFSSRLIRTLEEAGIIISMSDLSFVQHLPKVDKMELISKITHNMFNVTSLFSLVSAG